MSNEFTSFSTWLESLGTREYVLPENREQRLFDFFLLEMLRADINHRPVLTQREEILKQDINMAWKILLTDLRKELLNEVFYSIVSEMRHVNDMMDNQRKFDDDPLFADLRKQTHLGPNRQVNRVQNLVDRYQDQMNEFVKMSQRVFADGEWEVSYGGKAWAAICKAWLRLHNAKDLGDIQVWIDHVYDLQHNTDTVFNKLAAYNKRGFDWITDSLTFKQQAKNARDFIPYASPVVQKLANEVLRREPAAQVQPMAQGEKIKNLDGKKLDYIMMGRENRPKPWYSYMIVFEDRAYSLDKIFHINIPSLNAYAKQHKVTLNPALAQKYFERHLFKPGVRFTRCPDAKYLCVVLPPNVIVGEIFNDIDEQDFLKSVSQG